MEFVEWPQLKGNLKNVPDESIIPLINQLIQAVRFLENLNIVHRDIKPENIHVSPDWGKLKLLDLGVVREFDPGPDAAETDQGLLRPFLATAQYSSPEYLFRLDEPSTSLWQALNFYQVGAVLHDLIMKRPIFQSEIETGNRWLVAKAVLTKSPDFIDGNPARLASLKSLARKCLTKDIETRLEIVNWNSFDLLESTEALVTLRDRLSSRRLRGDDEISRKIKFEREQFRATLFTRVREQLISTCQTDLPFKYLSALPGKTDCSSFLLNPSNGITIGIQIIFDWQAGIYSRTANVIFSAGIFINEESPDFTKHIQITHSAIAIDSGIEENASDLCTEIARIIGLALDIIDNSASDQQQLNQSSNKDILGSH